MKIIAFQDIIELNHILEDNNLSFRVHLRDSCGGQAVYIEPLSSCGTEGKFEDMHTAVKEFFASRKFNVEIDETGLNLIIKE